VIWLVRFGDPTWQQQLQQWARDFKFRATLAPRLDREEEQWHAAQPQQPQPTITHEPDGSMRITAPWVNDDSTP
jgi:hypothetical protein